MAIFDYLHSRLDMAELAKQLKTLRELRKLSQTRLAELIGVSPRVYNRWENGDATPHWDSILKIANLLGVSLDELAGRTGQRDDIVINNQKLYELYKKVNLLSDEDQQALIILLDSLVARSQLNQVIGQSETIRK
jgi:transcriptional regulator with XRE-family HTH domain